MRLVENIKSLVGDNDARTYEYACGDCGTTFESPAANPNDTACPECGSNRTHSAL